MDEEFVAALGLMHSRDAASDEKLRIMLDSSIARKYGFAKTIVARFPDIANSQERMISQDAEIEASLLRELFAERSTKTIEIFTESADGSMGKGDVPRISIPDEGSTDGALCTVWPTQSSASSAFPYTIPRIHSMNRYNLENHYSANPIERINSRSDAKTKFKE